MPPLKEKLEALRMEVQRLQAQVYNASMEANKTEQTDALRLALLAASQVIMSAQTVLAVGASLLGE